MPDQTPTVVRVERPYPFTEEGAWNALNALGLDPDDIADELGQLGARGIPGSDCRCVLAIYLANVVQGCTSAGIYLDESDERATAHATLSAPGVDDVDTDLPAAVIVFVRRFDARKYEELIDEETRHG